MGDVSQPSLNDGDKKSELEVVTDCSDSNGGIKGKIFDLSILLTEKVYNKLYSFSIFGCIIVLVFFMGYTLRWYLEGCSISNMENELSISDMPNEVCSPSEVVKPYKFLNVDYDLFRSRNTDIQGYLKVNNTSIDYPVVQTTDNEYYLDHDIDKNINNAGWIFIDASNGLEFPGFNTVLYGHNRADGIVFGDLKRLLEPDVIRDANTQYISFSTKAINGVYQICSVYVLDYDEWAYYNTRFYNTSDKVSFVENINKYNQLLEFARTDLSTSDNYLTLSTCYGAVGTKKRLVVHARLVDIKVD